MAVIPQKELRNHVGEVLRRAEAGERITVTVSGRPVAELGPTTERRRWVDLDQIRAIWETPAPGRLAEDLDRFETGLIDPFA